MTIKNTAGKILLLFYKLQTDSPVKLSDEQISFNTTFGDNHFMLGSDKLLKMLRQISERDATLYNAFHYLMDKQLISFTNKSSFISMGGEHYLGIRLTADGIDVVESVEQGAESQKTFKSLFNLSFNFTPTVKVDSLIKAEVGNIVGIGGAISGKAEIGK